MIKYGFSRMGHSSCVYSSEQNSAQKHASMLAVICCPVGAFSGKLLACASSFLPMGFLGMVWELDRFIDPSPVTVCTQLPSSECWAEHWADPGRSMDLA